MSDRLALALARREIVGAAQLPERVLGKTAYDFLTLPSYGKNPRRCIEGVEKLWPQEVWRKAVLDAALSGEVPEIRPEAEATIEGCLADVDDAQFLELIQRGDGADTQLRWYRLLAARSRDPIRVQAEQVGEGHEGKYFFSEFLAVAVWAELLTKDGEALPDSYDGVVTRMIRKTSPGVRSLLRSLDAERRDRLWRRLYPRPSTTLGSSPPSSLPSAWRASAGNITWSTKSTTRVRPWP